MRRGSVLRQQRAAVTSPRDRILAQLVRLVGAVVAGLLLLLPLIGATPAQAHDALISTSPADGATVATTPSQIVLTFNQPALAVGTELRVSGPDGQVQQGRPRLVDNTVRQSLAPGSPAGRYTVVWRVTSADGHPVSGDFTFTATAASTAASTPATPTPSSQPSLTTSPDPEATTAAGSGQTGTPAVGPTSSTSTGGSDQGGTSWAVWLVVAVLAVAGAGAAAVRLRRGHAERGHG